MRRVIISLPAGTFFYPQLGLSVSEVLSTLFGRCARSQHVCCLPMPWKFAAKQRQVADPKQGPAKASDDLGQLQESGMERLRSLSGVYSRLAGVDWRVRAPVDKNEAKDVAAKIFDKIPRDTFLGVMPGSVEGFTRTSLAEQMAAETEASGVIFVESVPYIQECYAVQKGHMKGSKMVQDLMARATEVKENLGGLPVWISHVHPSVIEGIVQRRRLGSSEGSVRM